MALELYVRRSRTQHKSCKAGPPVALLPPAAGEGVVLSSSGRRGSRVDHLDCLQWSQDNGGKLQRPGISLLSLLPASIRSQIPPRRSSVSIVDVRITNSITSVRSSDSSIHTF